MTAQLLAVSLRNLPVFTLLLIALAAFVLVILVGAIATYFIACARSKGTDMKGTMNMSISLNGWEKHESQKDVPPEDVSLEGGTFRIAMKDPEDPSDDEKKYLFFPALSGLELAYTRSYPMKVFLHRYRMAFQNACGKEEPFCSLLESLEGAGVFCSRLGRLYRTDSNKGVRIRENGNFAKSSNRQDTITVYAEIPKENGELFFRKTGCTAKNICFTMEYSDAHVAK